MRGNQKNKNYVVKWTPEFAYAVGLLATDGCLSKDGRHIIFVSKDKCLVQTFKKSLGLENKIGTRSNGLTSEKKYFHVQFSNAKLHRYLYKIGLTPNKSKSIEEVKISNKYFFDFLRGHFDGDGSCFSYWDKRWPNSFMFYTYFISASLSHLKWLKARINKLVNINGSIDKSARTWQLQYAKHDSQVLWKKMYYKKNTPCLLRKYRKIENILKTQAQVMELGRHASLRRM